MTTQAALWSAVGAALAAAVAAGVLERRRGRRRDFDDVGWAPWRGIQVAALFAALAFAVFAMRA